MPAIQSAGPFYSPSNPTSQPTIPTGAVVNSGQSNPGVVGNYNVPGTNSPAVQAPTAGQVYTNPDGTPMSLDQQAAAADAAKVAANSPTAVAGNEASSRSDVLGQFQSQIDGLDQAAAQARATITSNLAPAAAENTRMAGVLAAAHGEADSNVGASAVNAAGQQNATNLNNAISASDDKFATQKSSLMQFIQGEADKEATARQTATTQGADAKISEIQNRTTRANTSAQSSVQAMIANGIDPTNPNYQTGLNAIATSTGLTKDQVTALYTSAKQTADATAAKTAQDAAALASTNATTAKTNAETGAVLTPAQVAAQEADKLALDKSTIGKNEADTASAYATAAKTKADMNSGVLPNGTLAGTTGKTAVDATTPGYATTAVAGGGGLSQAAIDAAALVYASTKTMPAMGNGSSGAAGERRAAIMNRAAELDPNGNMVANAATVTSNVKALTQQTEYLNTTQRSLSNAENGLNQLVTAFQGKVNDQSLPIANIISNASKYQLGDSDVNAYKAALAEVGNEYSQVFSRGGTTTDSVRNRANDIINGNISIADLAAVSKELQAQGNIVIGGAQQQVKSLQDGINNVLQPAGSTAATSTSPVIKAPDGKQIQIID